MFCGPALGPQQGQVSELQREMLCLAYFRFLWHYLDCGFLYVAFQLGEQPSLEEAIRIASRIQQGETPGLDD